MNHHHRVCGKGGDFDAAYENQGDTAESGDMCCKCRVYRISCGHLYNGAVASSRVGALS